MKKNFGKILSLTLCVLMLAIAVTTSVIAATTTYKDVKTGDWYYDFVMYMSEKEIINGYPSDNTFRANNFVKRAEFIKMLNETFGLKAKASISYSDVSENEWYYEHFQKAKAQGYLDIVYPYATKINPTEELSREEAVALLMAYLDLPEDEVAANKFSDYYSIDSDYRTFVFQAIEAGIIDGFEEEDGTYTFRPKESLRRAQAAKILSVAAGTITDVSIADLDAEKNLVITSSGVTLSDLIIPGNVYISEGISAGTITFIDCAITGRIFNRSGSTLILSGTSAPEVNLDSANAKLNLKLGATVVELNANGTSNIGFYTGSSVSKLNINKLAANSVITDTSANGTIATLTVKASGLTSAIVPTKAVVDSGITATIGNVKYEGGFKGDVELEWTDTVDLLIFSPYNTGKVRYYYTSSATKPSASNFNTYYTSAANKNEIAVSANLVYNQTLTATTVSVTDFPYLVVAFVDGTTVSTPRIISRTAAKTGFSVMPELSVSGNNDVIKYTAAYPGTLYYYYTNDSTVPATYDLAEANYKEIDAAFKGTSTVTVNTRTLTTKASNTLADYSYCVVFFKSSSVKYQPLLIVRPAATDGFKVAPEISISAEAGGKDTLTFTASKTGKLKYIYTDSNLVFNTTIFNNEYNNFDSADTIYHNTITVNTTSAVTKELSAGITKKYVVVMMVDFDGTEHTPIKLFRKSKATGFDTTPIAFGNKDNGLICFKTTGNGEVKYMYISNHVQYTVEKFDKEYRTQTNPDLYGIRSAAENATISVVTEGSSVGKYIVLMFNDVNHTPYTPVTIKVTNAGNGFISTPAVKTFSDGTTKLIGDTIAASEVKYFEHSTNESFTTTSFGTVDQNKISSVETNGKTNEYTLLSIQESSEVDYVVMLVVVKATPEPTAPGAELKTFSFNPIVVERKESKYGIKGDITINQSEDLYDTLTLSTDINGTLKYYYTNTLPANVTEFNLGYSKSSNVHGEPIQINEQKLIGEKITLISTVKDYRYFVCMFTDKEGVSYAPKYKDFGGNRTMVTLGTATDITLPVTVLADGNIRVIYSKDTIQFTPTNKFETKYGSLSTDHSQTTRTWKANFNVVKDSGTNAITLNDDYKYMYMAFVDVAGRQYAIFEYEHTPATT